MKKIFFAVFFIILAVVFYIIWLMSSHLPIDGSAVARIPYGASIRGAVNELGSQGMVSNPGIFSLIARAYAKFGNHRVYAGSYKFSSKQTHAQLLKAIFSGKQVYSEKVTFPEGITVKEFASILQRKIEMDSAEFVRLAYSDSLVKARNISANSVEGYLAPNTYNFYWRQSAKEILDKLLNAQERIWEEKFSSEAEQKGKSRHEILTFASIIEAETPVAAERPRVAGVYQNRLDRGIRLEANPTVQYALGSRKRLFNSDLGVDSPYNTYRITGLPPGPINSPSVSSIEAALNPEQNNFIYFVAKGDGSGEHNFSEKYSEHQRAVQDYRELRRAQK